MADLQGRWPAAEYVEDAAAVRPMADGGLRRWRRVCASR